MSDQNGYPARTTVVRRPEQSSEKSSSKNGTAANAPTGLMTQVQRQAPRSAATLDQPVQTRLLLEQKQRIRSMPKNTSPIDPRAHPSLLPLRHSTMEGRKCLILDVDETLVHSSYEGTSRYDLHLRVSVSPENMVDVYVAFRPFLKEFLEAVAPLFEIVIFTASMEKYCNPLMDAIDPHGVLGRLRLFRDHCSLCSTTYVKDLSLLGRELDQVVIIDNSPVAYLFQQRNAIPIISWFDDPADCELRDLIPVLQTLAESDNVYDVLDDYNAVLQARQAELDGQEDGRW